MENWKPRSRAYWHNSTLTDEALLDWWKSKLTNSSWLWNGKLSPETPSEFAHFFSARPDGTDPIKTALIIAVGQWVYEKVDQHKTAGVREAFKEALADETSDNRQRTDSLYWACRALFRFFANTRPHLSQSGNMFVASFSIADVIVRNNLPSILQYFYSAPCLNFPTQRVGELKHLSFMNLRRSFASHSALDRTRSEILDSVDHILESAKLGTKSGSAESEARMWRACLYLTSGNEISENDTLALETIQVLEKYWWRTEKPSLDSSEETREFICAALFDQCLGSTRLIVEQERLALQFDLASDFCKFLDQVSNSASEFATELSCFQPEHYSTVNPGKSVGECVRLGWLSFVEKQAGISSGILLPYLDPILSNSRFESKAESNML